MDLDISLGSIGVTFTVQKINAANEVIEDIGTFENMVLDCGLLNLQNYSIYDMTTFVNVGSSQVLVDPTQTGLQDRKYSTSNIFNSQKYSSYDFWPVCRRYTKVFQFDVGTCTGSFTEVGLSRANNLDYFNRQRFKNSDGYFVLVRVLATEGLRITCDIKLYPAATTRVYSEVYCLNLKGATAGDITFSNGTTTKTFSYAELTTNTSAKLAFETFLGIGKVTNYVLILDKYYIFAHPLNTESLNLSIQSNTLTGGSGPPLLEVIQSYESAIVASTTTIDDITGGQLIEQALQSYWVLSIVSMNFLTMRQATASGTQYNGWVHCVATDNNIMLGVFGNITARVITQAGTVPAPTVSQHASTPSANDVSLGKRSYYAPGAIGAGTQIIVGYTFYFPSDATPTFMIIKFSTPVTVLATEEYDFTIKFRWGRIVANSDGHYPTSA